MKRIVIAGTFISSVAVAKPTRLMPIKKGDVTISIPNGYKVGVAEKCISLEGQGSLYIIRTKTSREDFDKEESKSKAKRVAKDKVICFENTKPGENARCLVTTDAGNWVTQFVSFGKGYSKIGGSDTMQRMVASITGWDPPAYAGTYSLGTDCKPAD
jgi:hypothetical protein